MAELYERDSGLLISDIEKKKSEATEEIRKLQVSLKKEFDIQFNLEVKVGDLTNELLKSAKKHKANLIIMGT